LQRVVFLVQILASITHLTRKKGITRQRELLQQKVAMVAQLQSLAAATTNVRDSLGFLLLLLYSRT
jgi:cell division protein FtsB